MKGDFTREPFDPLCNFSRVLMQQGRVQLDADFNEQSAILLHLLRALVVDLIGPYGVPADGDDFLVAKDTEGEIKVGAGHYYVDGILVENHETTRVCLPAGNGSYFAYLDVWERHVTHVQYPRIREVALGMSGPDTCTRAQVTWRVRLEALDEIESKAYGTNCDGVKKWLDNERATQEPAERPRMRAWARKDSQDTSACSVPPESSYLRKENQLYRIEVHRGGLAWDGETDKDGAPIGNADEAATFKWSRDNGSVVFPIAKQEGSMVFVEHLGGGPGLGLDEGDWVETMDDDLELSGEPGILAQVKLIDPVALSVTLEAPKGVDWPESDEKTSTHPLLRRWDHSKITGQAMDGGAILLEEGATLKIEGGIEVEFVDRSKVYETGDYWLIPARQATGDIEWRRDEDGIAMDEPPAGIRHHYAPLALIIPEEEPTDCRCGFQTLACESLGSPGGSSAMSVKRSGKRAPAREKQAGGRGRSG